MEYTEEIKNKINILFATKAKFRDKLLNQDTSAIDELAKYAQTSFSSEEVLDYISEGNIQGLQAEAEKRKMARDIYFAIIGKTEDFEKRRRF